MNKEKQLTKESEFENFRRLTKSLIVVPKKEIDKQRDVYNRKTQKKRPAK
jgi:hypothetical protein